MEKKSKRYLVMVSYSIEVDDDDQIGAATTAAFLVKYGAGNDAKALTVRVIREVHSAAAERAMAEAPYADQVTVNEESPKPRVGDFLRDVIADPAPIPFAPTPLTDALMAGPVTADDIPF